MYLWVSVGLGRGGVYIVGQRGEKAKKGAFRKIPSRRATSSMEARSEASNTAVSISNTLRASRPQSHISPSILAYEDTP